MKRWTVCPTFRKNCSDSAEAVIKATVADVKSSGIVNAERFLPLSVLQNLISSIICNKKAVPPGRLFILGFILWRCFVIMVKKDTNREEWL